MITRPSIGELIAGLTRNLEATAGNAPASDLKQFFTPVLTVLDRVANEWVNWTALLAADNADIRSSLGRLGVALAPAIDRGGESLLAAPDAQSVIERLEQENRTLKRALVDAIERFDLPAGPAATAAQQDADREILHLLRRMLHREDLVDVAAPRVGPTSGNPSNASIPRERLAEVLERFLAARMPDATHIALAGLQPLPGGASREAWIFDVSWRQDGGERIEECILMREPVASVLVSDDSATVINGTRRTVATELKVVNAVAATGLPVPHVLWTDIEGAWLERPFSIARRLRGTADANAVMGTELGVRLLEQYIELLCRLHMVDPQAAGFDFLGRPSVHSAAVEQVHQFERNFHAQRLEEFPATTYMIRWLKKNPPTADRISVVHGDYRLGNFLYDDNGIVAILDWEQAHIGDPVEEIAFMYWSAWSLEPVCPIEMFVRRYEASMGCDVNRNTLAYYRVFIEFKMLVVLLTGLRSYFATPECQLHYGGAMTTKMIREAQLRVVEELICGGPTVAFDARERARS